MKKKQVVIIAIIWIVLSLFMYLLFDSYDGDFLKVKETFGMSLWGILFIAYIIYIIYFKLINKK